MSKAEKAIREEHEKMRKISAAWAGLGVHDVFKSWKKYTRREVRRRARDKWSDKKDELQWAADCVAAIELAHWNLEKYEKCHDEWSDLPFWRHLETGNVVWDEPTFELLLPVGMAAKFPDDLPVDDPHGWEQVLRDQALAQHGGDADIDASSDEASEAFTDMSDPDASEPEEEPSLLTGDPAPPAGDAAAVDDDEGAIVAMPGDSIEDEDREPEESESDESDDPDLLVWDRDEVHMPSTHDALAMMRLERATIADEDELGDREAAEKASRLERDRAAAAERARMRRKIKFHAKVYKVHKETAAEKAIKAAKAGLANIFGGGNREGAPETEEECMAMTGFQAGVNYTDAELTVFSKRCCKLMKKYKVGEEHEGNTVISDGTATLNRREAANKKKAAKSGSTNNSSAS